MPDQNQYLEQIADRSMRAITITVRVGIYSPFRESETRGTPFRKGVVFRVHEF